MKFHQWRDAQEWKKYGLDFSCTSNETLKLYDAALTQYVSWYEDDSLGGLEKTAVSLLEGNPEWVMGHVICNGLDLMGTGRSPDLDPEFKVALNKMEDMKKMATLTDLERSHVEAVALCGKGFMKEACNIWEDILVKYPQDMLAVKFAHDAYFYLGYQPQMRDSINRVLPHWKPSMPFYGYLLGMQSFGLVETNFYNQAEVAAKKGLEINANDAWSTHSMAHVLEMMGRAEEGVKFMSTTLADWEPCGMLACHNFWHWAVYHIEKGEYQGAFDIFDSKIGASVLKSGAMLDIVDACSLLFRLEMEGQNVEGRWNDIYETCASHTDDHLLCFNDVHILLSCLGAKKDETVKKMMESMTSFIENAQGTQRDVCKEVGFGICKSFVAYNEGNFALATDILAPLRYKILNIGGSNAQRDLFNLFLINSALKSNDCRHTKLAKKESAERKCTNDRQIDGQGPCATCGLIIFSKWIPWILSIWPAIIRSKRNLLR